MTESEPSARIADADRDIAARQLQLAVAQGELDLPELDRRLQAVYAARTSADLVATTADLTVVAAGREPLVLQVDSATRVKEGEWSVPAEITAACRSGSIRLDFTRAVCQHREIVVRAAVSSGGLTLIVPRGWSVDTDRVRISSGAIRNKVVEARLPEQPMIRVEGQVESGVIEARYPRPARRSFLAWLLRRPA